MKIGFIGCGNMAGAMIRGIKAADLPFAQEILASAKTEETKRKIQKDLKITCLANSQVAAEADILFLAVKPLYYAEIIREIREDVKDSALVVSIAPGKTLAALEEMFGRRVAIVRAMPNTPAMAGEGMTAYCANSSVTEAQKQEARQIFESFGKAEEVPENLMDVVTAVSGSGPAYIFPVIEAMADGAVLGGMPRSQAYRFAAQTVLGSAKMVLETGKHPAELKDMVCSPAGTTIEAVRVLESRGIRSAFIEAEKACLDKSRGM